MKQKNKQEPKKRNGKFVAGGTCGAVAAAALFAYFGGIIPGFGRNEAGSNVRLPDTTAAVTSDVQTETTTETTVLTTVLTTTTVSETASETTTTTTTAKPIPVIDVTVSGNGYTYRNRSYTAKELETVAAALEAAVKEAGTGAIIRISDQEASLNAYKSLTEKLTALSLPYEEVNP